MAPEVMLSGHISKSADVYAFGILLWELYTGGHPFRGLPRALLGHQVTMEDRRPMFPPDTPGHFKALAEWCWSKDPESRCGQLPGARGGDCEAAPWAAGWYQAAACTCQHSETYEQYIFWVVPNVAPCCTTDKGKRRCGKHTQNVQPDPSTRTPAQHRVPED